MDYLVKNLPQNKDRLGSKVTWEILIYKLREVHSKGPAPTDRLEMSETIKVNGESETLTHNPHMPAWVSHSP